MKRSLNFEVFVSYRRIDGWLQAEWLRRSLRGYRLPVGVKGKHGLRPRVFLDRVYGRASSDWYEKVVRPAIRSSKFMVVLATEAAAQRLPGGRKNWLEREIDDFLETPQAENIVPILAGRPGNERVPEAIRERFERAQYLDFRLPRGSLVGYWSARSRRRDEFLRLVAALWEVDIRQMPELLQEDRKAQLRRTTRFGLAGVFLAVFFGLLALFAFEQRGKAREQTLLAQARQLVSESRLEIIERSGSTPRALALAVESLRLRYGPEAFGVFLDAIESSPGLAARVDTLGKVTALAFDTSGERLIASLADQKIRILDAADGRQLGSFSHPWAIAGLELLSNTEQVLVLGGDEAHLWDLQPLRRVSVLPLGNTPTSWKQGSGWVAIATEDARLAVWSTEDWHQIAALEFEAPIRAMELAADARALVVAVAADPSLASIGDAGIPAFRSLQGILSGTTSTLLHVDLDHGVGRELEIDGLVTDLKMSQDRALLAVGLSRGDVLLHGTPDWILRHSLESRRRQVTDLFFSADGTNLIVCAEGSIITTWDVSSGRPGGRLVQPGILRQVEFDRAAGLLITSTAAGTVHGWDLSVRTNRADRTAREERWRTDVDPTFGAIALHGDKRRVALADREGSIFLLDLQREPFYESISIPLAGVSTSVVSDVNAERLAIASKALVKLYDFDTQEELASWVALSEGGLLPLIDVAMSREGDAIGIAGGERTVILDLPQFENPVDLEMPGETFLAVDFDASASTVLTGGQSGWLHGWSRGDHGEPVFSVELGQVILALAAEPEGDRVAVGTTDLTLHSTVDGEELLRVSVGESITAVDFASDNRVAVGTISGQVRVVYLDDGTNSASFAHEEEINTLAFSPDGRYLASASGNLQRATQRTGDDSFRIWDLEQGRELLRWSANSPVDGIVWGARTNRVGFATGSEFRLFDWTLDALEASACERLTRNLSVSEREQSGIDHLDEPLCSDLPLGPVPVGN